MKTGKAIAEIIIKSEVTQRQLNSIKRAAVMLEYNDFNIQITNERLQPVQARRKEVA